MNVLFGSTLLAAMLSDFLTLCSSAWAQQDYLSKPSEVMVAFQRGGGTDSLARTYAEAAKRFIA